MREFIISLHLFLIFLLLTACGGGGTEGHVSYDSAIVGISNISPSKLESDVFVRVDNDKDGICDAVHIQDDTVVVSFIAYPLMNPEESWVSASPIYIDRYRIKFFNASSSNNCERYVECKSLFSVPVEGLMSLTVKPDSPAYFALPVIPSDWKSSVLISYCTSPMDSCVYNVSVEFHAVEVFSGEGNWIKGAFVVQIADYIQGNALTFELDPQTQTIKYITVSEKDADCVMQGGLIK